jgi:hypothetical protein
VDGQPGEGLACATTILPRRATHRRRVTLGRDMKFHFTDFDPGGFKHPAKAKNTGELELIAKNGGHRFDFDGSREKIGGSLAGWAIQSEDAVTSDARNGCRVTMAYRAKPEITPKQFVLVGTSKAEFDAALSELAQQIAAGEATQAKIADGAWWFTGGAFKCLGFTESFSVSETTYHGGWTPHPQSHKNDILRIDKKGISLSGFKTIFTIPWEQVTDISVDGPENASKRVTAGRVAMLGVFALAAKKKTKSTVILVDTLSGDQAVFETAKALPHEIGPKLTPLANQARRYAASRQAPAGGSSPAVAPGSAVPVSAPNPATTVSVADELAKLADLHTKGILSDEEFAAQKSKLLSS